MRIELLARNNAAWCRSVCATHGISTAAGDRVWASPRRTPDLYPDAVTLDPGVSVDEVVALVDTSAGCSVKDSFATLDLGPAGFGVLFSATWIVHRPVPAEETAAGWHAVRDPDDFARWELAWRAGAPDQRGILRPSLLDRDDVAVVGCADAGRYVAGAVLNRSEGLVGVGNTFAADDLDSIWSAAVGFAARRFPGLPVCGYESGPALASAVRHRFEPLGPLRVWIK